MRLDESVQRWDDWPDSTRAAAGTRPIHVRWRFVFGFITDDFQGKAASVACLPAPPISRMLQSPLNRIESGNKCLYLNHG